MLERAGLILKVLCVALALVFVLEIARVVVRHNPVGRLSVPQLPTLPAKTNATAQAKTKNNAIAKADGKNETNGVADKSTAKTGTNSIQEEANKIKDTNMPSVVMADKKATNAMTNAVVGVSKKAGSAAGPEGDKKGTNQLAVTDFGSMKTNVVAGTNALPTGTNATLAEASSKAGTNSGPEKSPKGRRSFPFMPGQMGGEKLPDLPPLIQARIDKIIASEILAQLTKPQPTGLLGIAGRGAMLRSSTGQTGYVKEGGELGGLKLLQVGVNRVLVAEDGKTNELTIFSGIGGESLLPKQGDTNNETITKVQTTTQ